MQRHYKLVTTQREIPAAVLASSSLCRALITAGPNIAAAHTAGTALLGFQVPLSLPHSRERGAG